MAPIKPSLPVVNTTFRRTLFNRVPHLGSRALVPRYSSSSVLGSVKVDQTKKSNDPSESQKQDHMERAQGTGRSEGRDHPAKQPDPQQSPSKATGIETEGPGSKSGTKEEGGVTTDRGAGPFMKK
jgi:hypothetical protein